MIQELSIKKLILMAFFIFVFSWISLTQIKADNTCCDMGCCASNQVDGHCNYSVCCDNTCHSPGACSYNPGDPGYENCSGYKCPASKPSSVPCGGGCTPGATSCSCRAQQENMFVQMVVILQYQHVVVVPKLIR